MERFCSDILTSSLCPGNGMRNVFRRAFVLEGGNFVCEMPVTIIRLSSCGKIENPDYLASFDRGQPVVEGNRFHYALRYSRSLCLLRNNGDAVFGGARTSE